MANTIETARDAMAQSSIPALRGAISRLAARTPDVVYASGDIDPQGRDRDTMSGIIPGLLLLGAYGDATIPSGGGLSCRFGALSANDGPSYGDWTVEMTRSRCDPGLLLLAGPIAGEADLGLFDPQDLRDTLSQLSRLTPKTLYIEPGFAAGLGNKTINDGSDLGPVEQGAMLICGALKTILKPQDRLDLSFVSVRHTSQQATLWQIGTVRHTDG